MEFFALAVGAFVVVFIFTVLIMATRYKRCPSDRILVIYGKVAKERSSKCMHGGVRSYGRSFRTMPF